MLFAGELKGVYEKIPEQLNTDPKDKIVTSDEVSKGKVSPIPSGYVLDPIDGFGKKTAVTLEDFLNSVGYNISLTSAELFEAFRSGNVAGALQKLIETKQGLTEKKANIEAVLNQLAAIQGKQSEITNALESSLSPAEQTAALKLIFDELKTAGLLTTIDEKTFMELAKEEGALASAIQDMKVLQNANAKFLANVEKVEADLNQKTPTTTPTSTKETKGLSDKAAVMAMAMMGNSGTAFSTSVGFGGGSNAAYGNSTMPSMYGSMSYATGPMSNPMAMMMNNDFIVDSMASAFKSQSEGQKMMALFMYLAQAAMTGDVGAMYRFMMFITWIISRDKAREAVKLSEVVMQQQEESRKVTQLMVDASNSGDNAILNKYNNDLKEIAMGQKLIVQTMEDFFQVNEFLTNLTDEARRTHARIMRNITSR